MVAFYSAFEGDLFEHGFSGALDKVFLGWARTAYPAMVDAAGTHSHARATARRFERGISRCSSATGVSHQRALAEGLAHYGETRPLKRWLWIVEQRILRPLVTPGFAGTCGCGASKHPSP